MAIQGHSAENRGTTTVTMTHGAYERHCVRLERLEEVERLARALIATLDHASKTLPLGMHVAEATDALELALDYAVLVPCVPVVHAPDGKIDRIHTLDALGMP